MALKIHCTNPSFAGQYRTLTDLCGVLANDNSLASVWNRVWLCPFCYHEVKERRSAPNNQNDSFIFWVCPRCRHHMRRLRHAIEVRPGGITLPENPQHITPTTEPQLEDR